MATNGRYVCERANVSAEDYKEYGYDAVQRKSFEEFVNFITNIDLETLALYLKEHEKEGS